METNAITIEDLNNLKQELIHEMKVILSEQQLTSKLKWIKSNQVRRLLSISPGTLIQLRENGTLTGTKIGGVFYYDVQKIEAVLKGKKQPSVTKKFLG